MIFAAFAAGVLVALPWEDIPDIVGPERGPGVAVEVLRVPGRLVGRSVCA